MDVRLSEGTIEAINEGTCIANALLQVVNLRRIDGPPTRYRLMMSDGRHSFSSFMLASQLNRLVDEGHVEIHCVCNVKKMATNTIKDGRQVVIILEMDVVKSAKDIGGKIGVPTPYLGGQTSSPQKADQTPPPPARAPAPPPARAPAPPPARAPAPPPARAPAPPPPAPPHSPHTASSSRGGYGRGYGRGKKTASVGHLSPGPSPTKPDKMVPIASLNPYQTKWTIRARVTNKSSIRTWNNSRGEGKLFSFEIVDESGEIRITAFNKEVDKFFSLVEAGKVYYISRATLKVANKQFNPLKNDYEISLHADSSILPCDDSREVPIVQCHFVPIAELENRDKDAILDVIGLCRHAEEVSKITTKTSREVSKRALHLLDSSGKEVTVTLWGEEAEKFDGTGQPVVAIKGARLSDFGGRSLSALFSSTVMVNPDLPEAVRLRSWYDHEGRAINSQSLSAQRLEGGGANTVWKTLYEVKQEHLGQGEKADYFSCVATVLFCRKDSCVYRACPSSDCNKKLVDQHDGSYRCERCDRPYNHFRYRLILSANIADFGENQWVTCFHETAETLLGQSAETLGRLKDTNEAAFDEVFQKANFSTHVFRNRIKMETYNDEARVKATVMDIKPVDHQEYSRRLISNIRKMAA